ncbi:putative cyclin PHO80, Cyclin-like superfamily [Septoria linicola]|nr:putative cyclin PHO80, Cyclin-like superfamily [Septoria linicola]
MSTLTSSPSHSPRNPFHHPSPRGSYAPSSSSRSTPATGRHSPRLYPASANSSRRPFNAPSTTAAVSQQPNKPNHLHQLDFESPVAGGAYVSTGTQYSPDGLPPTAGPKLAAAVGKPPGSTASIRSAKKRKEALTSPDSSPELMSGASASSGAPHRAQQTPDEPDPRADPARSASGSTSATSPALQEARSTHGHSAAPKRSRGDPASLKVMPLKYEKASTKDLGVLVANMLMELIRINDQIPLRDGRLTRFHSRAPPGISVSDYLQRLIQHATLSPPILLSMVYYIDRLCTMYPAFTINSLTVHRFLITAATVAAKGLSDSFWTNPTYARIGGIPVSELATLELELLQRVDWKIVPKPETLEEYYRSLVDRTEGFVMEPTSSASDSSSILDSEADKMEDDDMAERDT